MNATHVSFIKPVNFHGKTVHAANVKAVVTLGVVAFKSITYDNAVGFVTISDGSRETSVPVTNVADITFIKDAASAQAQAPAQAKGK